MDLFSPIFSYRDPDMNTLTAAGSKTVLAVGPGPASIVDQVATSYPSLLDRNYLNFIQCCGSMTFWCGSGSESGSADPCL